MHAPRAADGSAPVATARGGMPPAAAPQDDCYTRAMTALAEVLNCIWETVKPWISWISCGYLCAPAAAPPSLDSFKNPLVAAILSKYRYNEAHLRAVIDRLFQIISPHQITNVGFSTGPEHAAYIKPNYIVITSGRRTDLIDTLQRQPKKISFETDCRKFGVPAFDTTNQIAIQIYDLINGESWMDAFVDTSNDPLRQAIQLLTESHGLQHDDSNIERAANNLLVALAEFPIKNIGRTAFAQWLNIEFNGTHSSAALAKLTSQFPRLSTLTPSDQNSLQIQVTSLDVLLPEGRA